MFLKPQPGHLLTWRVSERLREASIPEIFLSQSMTSRPLGTAVVGLTLCKVDGSLSGGSREILCATSGSVNNLV